MANRSYHPRRPLADRFWEKVDKENGPVHPVLGRCWVWTAAKTRAGYGRIAVSGPGRKWQEAHRVAFFIEDGRWPQPMGLHHCDNPPCVRRSHLFEGDGVDNARDRDRKGRAADHVGSANGRARLSAEDVAEIRMSGAGTAALARRFGVSKGQIWRARKGSAWATVIVADNGKRPLHVEVTPRGSGHGNAKVTEDDVVDIRSLFAFGARRSDLASAFGLGNTAVEEILNKKTWKHVA